MATKKTKPKVACKNCENFIGVQTSQDVDYICKQLFTTPDDNYLANYFANNGVWKDVACYLYTPMTGKKKKSKFQARSQAQVADQRAIKPIVFPANQCALAQGAADLNVILDNIGARIRQNIRVAQGGGGGVDAIRWEPVPPVRAFDPFA